MAGSLLGAIAAPVVSSVMGSVLGGGQTAGGQVAGTVAGGMTAAALNNGNANAQTAANTANPFGSQYAGYQQQLSSLMTDPGSFTMTPEAQAQLNQSMDATNAKMGAAGLTNSGAQEAALSGLATTAVGNNYQQQMSNLMQLSGANTSNPAAAGNILQQQNAIGEQNAGAAGAAVGQAVSSGISGLMNSQQSGTGTGVNSVLNGSGTDTGPLTYGNSQTAAASTPDASSMLGGTTGSMGTNSGSLAGSSYTGDLSGLGSLSF